MEKVGVWKKRAQRNDRNRWNKWQIIKINECDLFGSIVPFFFDARHRWCAVFWCVVYLRDLVIAIVIHTINTFQYDFRRSVGRCPSHRLASLSIQLLILSAQKNICTSVMSVYFPKLIHVTAHNTQHQCPCQPRQRKTVRFTISTVVSSANTILKIAKSNGTAGTKRIWHRKKHERKEENKKDIYTQRESLLGSGTRVRRTTANEWTYERMK